MSDVDETISAIKHAQELPMSIIIVGVGSAEKEFKKMAILNDDEHKVFTKRDLVQFVRYRAHFADGVYHPQAAYNFGRAVLEALPNQVVAYMKLMKFTPGSPVVKP